jgi:hypothetical protein
MSSTSSKESILDTGGTIRSLSAEVIAEVIADR